MRETNLLDDRSFEARLDRVEGDRPETDVLLRYGAICQCCQLCLCLDVSTSPIIIYLEM